MPTPVPTIPVFPRWFTFLHPLITMLFDELEGVEGARSVRNASGAWAIAFIGVAYAANMLRDEYSSLYTGITIVYGIIAAALLTLAIGMHVRAKRLTHQPERNNVEHPCDTTEPCSE